jgi:two-component system, LytTR family, response regulator
MPKVIIIDDEPLARSIIKEYLQDHQQLTLVEECNDGFEGVKAIMQHQPDIIFLDIQMPKINGFEMLELLEQPPAVIFTTAYDEYAIRAFENSAVDYLLNPINKERFDRALQKWAEQKNIPEEKKNTQSLLESAAQSPQQSQRIVVRISGKIRIIPIEEVQYLEASDDYVKVHTKDGSFLKNKTMGYFEKVLDPGQFVRTHRSFIVNIHLITRIDPHEKENYIAILKTGVHVPVSKTGYPRLKEVLGI